MVTLTLKNIAILGRVLAKRKRASERRRERKRRRKSKLKSGSSTNSPSQDKYLEPIKIGQTGYLMSGFVIIALSYLAILFPPILIFFGLIIGLLGILGALSRKTPLSRHFARYLIPSKLNIVFLQRWYFQSVLTLLKFLGVVLACIVIVYFEFLWFISNVLSLAYYGIILVLTSLLFWRKHTLSFLKVTGISVLFFYSLTFIGGQLVESGNLETMYQNFREQVVSNGAKNLPSDPLAFQAKTLAEYREAYQKYYSFRLKSIELFNHNNYDRRPVDIWNEVLGYSDQSKLANLEKEFKYKWGEVKNIFQNDMELISGQKNMTDFNRKPFMGDPPFVPEKYNLETFRSHIINSEFTNAVSFSVAARTIFGSFLFFLNGQKNTIVVVLLFTLIFVSTIYISRMIDMYNLKYDSAYKDDQSFFFVVVALASFSLAIWGVTSLAI